MTPTSCATETRCSASDGRHDATTRHAGDQARRTRRGRWRACAERQHEHAEQRAVEERPEPVDDFDERPEAGGIDRDHAGERRPRSGRELRHRQIVRVGGLGLTGAAGRCRSRVAVASEFSSAAMLDIAAAKIAAMIRPTRPIGSCVVTNVGNT